MAQCPYCKKDIGDLDHIMNQLSKNKMNSEIYFQSECCAQKIKAYSDNQMRYFIVAADPHPAPEMIGAG